MSDLPTLVVDEDWVAITRGSEGQRTVRIDGDLPTIYLSDKQGPTRPLRVGDRVTLAKEMWVVGHYEPFATATVEKIVRTVHVSGKNRYFVTVTDVKELEWQPTTTATSNEQNQPTQPSGTASTTPTGGSSVPEDYGMKTRIVVSDGTTGMTPDMLRTDKFDKAREFKEAFSDVNVNEANRGHH